MSHHQDDPRISAYVLDEMDADEREAFERDLAEDAELRAEVESMQALTGELATAMAPAPDAGLAPLQRTRIENAVAPTRALPTWMLSAAVLLGIGVSIGLAVLWMNDDQAAAPHVVAKGGNVFHAVQPDGSTPRLDYRGIEEVEETAVFGGDGESDAVFEGRPGAAPKPDVGIARPTGMVNPPSTPTPPVGPATPGPVNKVTLSGPATNGTIGIGGGGGGAFRGRGVHARRFVVPQTPGGGGYSYGVPARVPTGPGSEAYDNLGENPFLEALKQHTSTFSLDVDTASYANVRRFLMHQGVLPPAGAVRIEELVNYFAYGYEAPRKDATHPFATYAQIAACPWNGKHLLARVAVKGKVVDAEDRPAANLVFLIDVSGSMKPENKLPLVKQGLRLLLEKLDARDKVAIVTYAGNAGVALPSTSCAEKEPILAAIDKLAAGGSTNGEAGIELAYKLAKDGFVKGGINRVMLATDGDFNVGNTSRGILIQQIKQRAKAGTYLSILGFGMGNYKDGRMEGLSNACDGTYAYIDSLAEAKKVLVEGVTGQLVPIAKDVKVQVFFNPKTVTAYRLIGYENRRLAAKDFNDDRKDAGDVGAGHTVTAFYEIVPVGTPHPGRAIDPNPFVNAPEAAPKPAAPAIEHATALFQLRLRYKQPDGDTSTLIEQMIEPSDTAFDATGDDFRFATAVAAFGMKLRQSPHQGRIGWDAILEVAESAVGEDPNGRRSEFLQLVKKAKELMGG